MPRLGRASVDNCGAISLQLKEESRKEYARGLAPCSPFNCRGGSHRRSGIQDESFEFNHSHVFYSCLDGCVQRCKRPNGHETVTANDTANRHESTTGRDRGSVDQFDRRPLDGSAAQIMALAGSALPWLGVPHCVGPDVRGTTVRRIRGARAACAIGLFCRCIRGSRAFRR